MLLWLWHRLAAAATIQPLAQEVPYAIGAVVKRKNNFGEKMKKKDDVKSNRENQHITYKRIPIRSSTDFSAETL